MEIEQTKKFGRLCRRCGNEKGSKKPESFLKELQDRCGDCGLFRWTLAAHEYGLS